jgi:hypothetical protein
MAAQIFSAATGNCKANGTTGDYYGTIKGIPESL